MSLELWSWAFVVAVVVLLVVAAYVSWTAGRLDRLHHRVATARASLETELARRSALVAELAGSGALDPASSLLLLDAAHRARTATDDEREQCESALTRAIAATVGTPAPGGSGTSGGSGASGGGGGAVGSGGVDGVDGREAEVWTGELAGSVRRVQLARRFHNDIVATTRDLRRRRLVTWFRLAGHAPMPRTIELDDGS